MFALEQQDRRWVLGVGIILLRAISRSLTGPPAWVVGGGEDEGEQEETLSSR